MRSLLESGNGELHVGHLKAVVVYISPAVPRSQIVLLDCKRVVGLLSPKAIFILAWGNAPGLGIRIPGAMPLAMVIMAVGQSECPLFAGSRLLGQP